VRSPETYVGYARAEKFASPGRLAQDSARIYSLPARPALYQWGLGGFWNRATLPIRRVVGPADVAALAVHIVTNTALTGATYDVDGGQQLVAVQLKRPA